MRREVLDRANAIQAAVDQYDKLAYIVTYPYIKARLHKKLLQLSTSNELTEVTIADPDLAKVIAEYCATKKARLLVEFASL